TATRPPIANDKIPPAANTSTGESQDRPVSELDTSVASVAIIVTTSFGAPLRSWRGRKQRWYHLELTPREQNQCCKFSNLASWTHDSRSFLDALHPLHR